MNGKIRYYRKFFLMMLAMNLLNGTKGDSKWELQRYERELLQVLVQLHFITQDEIRFELVFDKRSIDVQRMIDFHEKLIARRNQLRGLIDAQRCDALEDQADAIAFGYEGEVKKFRLLPVLPDQQ